MASLDQHEPEGDAACWLSELCRECGSITENPDAQLCWQCGAPLATREA